VDITRGKLLSLVIALGYLVSLIFAEGWRPKELVQLCVMLLVPLAFIWFPEEIGSAKGAIGHGAVDKETPDFLVSFLGWSILIGAPLAALYFAPRAVG